MTTDTKSIKLGELLIKAGLLKSNLLKKMVQMGNETALPIGRVLIMSKTISEDVLRAAVQAQAMIRDHLVDEVAAVEALRLSAAEGISLDDALERVLPGPSVKAVLPGSSISGGPRAHTSTARLGELLVAAELISKEDLEDALRTRDETGLPLGRILVLTRLLSEELLSAALTAQVLLRDSKITREQAVEGLRSARKRRVTIEVALADQGLFKPPVKQSIRLGDLLVLAELIMENDLMTALELSLVRQLPVGRIMQQTGLISQPVLESALQLQEMVASGSLNSLQAAQALRQVAIQRYSLPQALAELGTKEGEPKGSAKLGDILKAAGVVTEKDIKRAVELSTKNSALVGKMLVAAGTIDEQMLYAALRCQFLVRDGFLEIEQAVIALKRCQQTGKTLDEVIRELGWTLSTGIKI
ncbi:MAG: hypothetical protein C5B53_09830 [Candidatus Melainabacteria bacterium]|nr:MAG: hypothetical protein C5B53_09830 [Candidatus Melainabacteria bacterium]